MSWLEKLFDRNNIIKTRKPEIPEGVWMQCPDCSKTLYKVFVEQNLYVCPECAHHMRMPARRRLECFLDEKEQVEMASELEPKDIIGFKDLKHYQDRLLLAHSNFHLWLDLWDR